MRLWMLERFRRHCQSTDRDVCVFAGQRLSRWRRCFCWTCPLCTHTGHELDRSHHWPVDVCPAVCVESVQWSPVNSCWPAVQSVPPTTTDVIVNHIEHVVDRCLCSLTRIGCVGAVHPSHSPRTSGLLSSLNTDIAEMWAYKFTTRGLCTSLYYKNIKFSDNERNNETQLIAVSAVKKYYWKY